MLPCLEGHSVVMIDDVLLVYGGKTGPTKLNPNIYTLHFMQELHLGRWRHLMVTGLPPPPRVYHTAVAWQKYMIVFGGLLLVGTYDVHYSTYNVYMNVDTLDPAVLRLSGPARRQRDPNRIYTSYTPVQAMREPSSLYILDATHGDEGCHWTIPTVCGHVPVTRHNHVAALHRDHMIVYGGYSVYQLDQRELFEVHSLDLTSMVWNKVEVTSVPPCVFGSSMVISDTMLLLFGGINGLLGMEDNTMYALNLTAKKHMLEWRCLDNANLPPPRAMHTCTAAGNSVYVFGGYCDVNSRLATDMWEFSLADAKFRMLGPKGTVPPPRSGHSATMLRGQIIMIGGLDQRLQRSNKVWKFDPRTTTWSHVNCTYEGECQTLAGAKVDNFRIMDFSTMDKLRGGAMSPPSHSPARAQQYSPSPTRPQTASVEIGTDNTLGRFRDLPTMEEQERQLLAQERKALSASRSAERGALSPNNQSASPRQPSTMVGIRFTKDKLENALNVASAEARRSLIQASRAASVNGNNRQITPRVITPSLDSTSNTMKSPSPSAPPQYSYYQEKANTDEYVRELGKEIGNAMNHIGAADWADRRLYENPSDRRAESAPSAPPMPWARAVDLQSSLSPPHVLSPNGYAPCYPPVPLEEVYAHRANHIPTEDEEKEKYRTKSAKFITDNPSLHPKFTNVVLPKKKSIQEQINQSLLLWKPNETNGGGGNSSGGMPGGVKSRLKPQVGRRPTMEYPEFAEFDGKLSNGR
eukprot:PhF_6_TR29326/c0_g1_i1/m.43034